MKHLMMMLVCLFLSACGAGTSRDEFYAATLAAVEGQARVDSGRDLAQAEATGTAWMLTALAPTATPWPTATPTPTPTPTPEPTTTPEPTRTSTPPATATAEPTRQATMTATGTSAPAMGQGQGSGAGDWWPLAISCGAFILLVILVVFAVRRYGPRIW